MFQTTFLEKIKTLILYSNFFSENRAIYEIMSKNVVDPDKPHMTVQQGACALHA